MKTSELTAQIRALDQENAGAARTDGRGDACAFCRWGCPLSEVEPKHEWYDSESGKIHEAPCYFDLDSCVEPQRGGSDE